MNNTNPQLIAEGSSKLASVPSGGAAASSGGAAPAAAAGGDAAPAEEKKEEAKEESDDDMVSLGFVCRKNAMLIFRASVCSTKRLVRCLFYNYAWIASSLCGCSDACMLLCGERRSSFITIDTQFPARVLLLPLCFL